MFKFFHHNNKPSGGFPQHHRAMAEIDGSERVTLTEQGKREIYNQSEGGTNLKIASVLESNGGSMIAWQLAKASGIDLEELKTRLPMLKRARIVNYDESFIHDGEGENG